MWPWKLQRLVISTSRGGAGGEEETGAEYIPALFAVSSLDSVLETMSRIGGTEYGMAGGRVARPSTVKLRQAARDRSTAWPLASLTSTLLGMTLQKRSRKQKPQFSRTHRRVARLERLGNAKRSVHCSSRSGRKGTTTLEAGCSARVVSAASYPPLRGSGQALADTAGTGHPQHQSGKVRKAGPPVPQKLVIGPVCRRF